MSIISISSQRRYLKLTDYVKWMPGLAIGVIWFRLKVLLSKKRNYFRGNVSVRRSSQLNVLHCYQSEYVHNFLLNNHFDAMLPLKDLLNDEIVNHGPLPLKEKNHLYESQKGFEIYGTTYEAFVPS